MILTPTTKPKLCVSILGFLTQIAAGVKGEREEREEREGMQAREVLREPNASLGCYPSGLLLFIKSKSGGKIYDFSLEISSRRFLSAEKTTGRRRRRESENQRIRELGSASKLSERFRRRDGKEESGTRDSRNRRDWLCDSEKTSKGRLPCHH